MYEDDTGLIDNSDMQQYKSMMDKLSASEWDGDRDNWDDEISSSVWQRVITDHRQCAGRNCSHVRNCAFFKARDALSDADCIVANHDLVLADLALGGGVILPPPEDTIYIFDEGHHLPDKALSHFATSIRYRSTLRWLGQSEGQWPELLKTVEAATFLVALAQPLESRLKAARSILEDNLPLLHDLTAAADRNQPNPRLRFENGVVPQPLEILAQSLMVAFGDLVTLLNKLCDELTELIEKEHSVVPKVDLENLYPLVASWLARAEANESLWRLYSHTEIDREWPLARWISLVDYGGVSDYEVVAGPILASRTLARDLWARCSAAVVTSATLTALNSFDRFKLRAGTFEHSVYTRVPSPFKYETNASLVIPEAAVEANDAQRHTRNLIDILPRIIDTSAGSLVLFSSRRQMTEVYAQLPPALQQITLLQGVESKQKLLRTHKGNLDADRGSIIFGLASFAEGVDLPGKYCTHVVIAKIPFAVPDDPLEASLAEWIESDGGNAFMQMSVPDASMRLIQACGRLLRTESDIGTVTILDKRLRTKRYGKALLDALPPFRRDF